MSGTMLLMILHYYLLLRVDESSPITLRRRKREIEGIKFLLK